MEEELLRHDRLVMLGKWRPTSAMKSKPLMIIGGFARQIRDHAEAEPEKNLEKLDIIIGEIKRLEDFLAEVGPTPNFRGKKCRRPERPGAGDLPSPGAQLPGAPYCPGPGTGHPAPGPFDAPISGRFF
jgi:hypothetical protein